MKILQIIRKLDSTYEPEERDYCSHILAALAPYGGYEKLPAISSGMSKLLKTELSESDRNLAELFLSAVNSLSNILGVLIDKDDYSGVMFTWFTKQITANTLETFSRALNDFNSLYPPAILAMLKESMLSNITVGYAPFTSLADTKIRHCQGVLQLYHNVQGMETIGFCYTSSAEDVTASASRKRKYNGKLYPFIISTNSALFDASYNRPNACITESHLGLQIPLLIKKG